MDSCRVNLSFPFKQTFEFRLFSGRSRNFENGCKSTVGSIVSDDNKTDVD
jgi:ribosomal protein L2